MSTVELPSADTSLPPRSNPRVIKGKGEFVAAGVTCLVERLPNGDIIKSPWEDPARGDCVQDIITEARIYQRLGEHPRLVKLRSWDTVQHTMVMEFMPHGTLQKYIEDHHGDISPQQQLQWAQQASEGLHLLHTAGILHCDVGPHNFLLDATLDLKIADFGGSSVDGSCASVCPGTRYRAPDPEWRPGKPPNLNEDLFALGSVLYFIFTGSPPFYDLQDEVVERNYEIGVFPELAGVPYADVVSQCWHQRANSALQVRKALGRQLVDGY